MGHSSGSNAPVRRTLSFEDLVSTGMQDQAAEAAPGAADERAPASMALGGREEGAAEADAEAFPSPHSSAAAHADHWPQEAEVTAAHLALTSSPPPPSLPHASSHGRLSTQAPLSIIGSQSALLSEPPVAAARDEGETAFHFVEQPAAVKKPCPPLKLSDELPTPRLAQKGDALPRMVLFNRFVVVSLDSREDVGMMPEIIRLVRGSAAAADAAEVHHRFWGKELLSVLKTNLGTPAAGLGILVPWTCNETKALLEVSRRCE